MFIKPQREQSLAFMSLDFYVTLIYVPYKSHVFSYEGQQKQTINTNKQQSEMIIVHFKWTDTQSFS